MSKKQAQQSLLGPALTASLCILFILSSAVGYIWQKAEVYKLGQAVKAHELRLDDLVRQNDSRRRAMAGLLSPAELDARVRTMNLGLVVPTPDQIIRIDPTSVLTSGSNTLAAARNRGQ